MYVVGRTIENPAGQQQVQPLDEAGNSIYSQETCDTFKFVELPDKGVAVRNPNCACLKGSLYVFGGVVVKEGPNFGYIWCTFDLQEFETRYKPSYKVRKRDKCCLLFSNTIFSAELW